MSTQYRSTRVLANTVYCNLISDKMHTHMNGTIWSTLSTFVQSAVEPAPLCAHTYVTWFTTFELYHRSHRNVLLVPTNLN